MLSFPMKPWPVAMMRETPRQQHVNPLIAATTNSGGKSTGEKADPEVAEGGGRTPYLSEQGRTTAVIWQIT
ncbi:hypothetical protein [Saccharopolyspora sp. 5N708]|uniref:hypothetical protein n=1 Tax=Saccharopolyspora sp. 5N708 TaxID=3457424 RepID=UPI003FCF2C4F